MKDMNTFTDAFASSLCALLLGGAIPPDGSVNPNLAAAFQHLRAETPQAGMYSDILNIARDFSVAQKEVMGERQIV